MKKEISLHNLPEDLISLIISSLDYQSFLSLRLVSKAWEQLSRYYFISRVNEKIICGPGSVFLARANGELWGWGNNSDNQLAMAEFKSSPKGVVVYAPQKVSLQNVAITAMGFDFSLLITKNGEVYSSGNNSYGQLGVGDKETYTVPQLIPQFKATQVVAGDSFALALGEDRKLYSWGRNDSGQLGLGHKKHCFTPQLIPNFTNVNKIAAGKTLSVALTSNGELYTWGRIDPTDYDNECHSTPQLIATIKNTASVSAGDNFIMTLQNGGKAFTWGRNSDGKFESVEVPGIENIVKISVNLDNCLALSDEGAIYYWVKADVWKNCYKPRKVSDLNNIIEIGRASGAWIALDENGLLHGWGRNNMGALGMGENCTECIHPQKGYSFEEPLRTKLVRDTVERLVKERLPKALLKSEQKTPLFERLSFFSSKNENQFSKEIDELKQALDDGKSGIVQLEDKIDNYLNLLEKDTSKEPLYACLSDIKGTLSKTKPIILKEIKNVAKAEVEKAVFNVMMKK